MRATVTPAQTAGEIEQVIRQNETTVFAPGRYCLERPLRLLGMQSRTLLGEPGAVLCGARPARVRWEARGENLYGARLAPGLAVDGLRAGEVSFRLARYPHASDPNAIFGGTAADALEFAASCAHPEDGVLHAMHAHLWGDVHYQITGRGADGTLALRGGWQNNRPMGMHREYRFVENLREALGAPGEFFYDRRTGELLVCALEAPGEEIHLISQPYLVEMRDCRNVRWEGLVFEDSARTFLAPYEPLLRSDWCIHRGGAVFAENVADIALHGCEFRRLGSNALFFSGNAARCTVSECYFHDLAASAICFVGKPSCVSFPCSTVDAPEFFPPDVESIGPQSEEYARDCTVENCLIRDIGRVEKQTACVEIAMSARIRVARCTLHTCPRAAINIGDGTFGGHCIEGNDIFDTVRETGDHGSVNGWGRDRFWHAHGLNSAQMRDLALRDAVETTVLRQNRVRCDHGWDIDLDDGCSNYLVEDNLCLAGGLKFREGFCRIARGNRLINNTFHPHVWFENSGDVFEGNLVMRPYLPIGMPERWGERVDGNLLAVASGPERPAAELARLSGQDESSIARPVAFDENLRPLDGRFSQNGAYGVTSAHLRALAAACPVDAPTPLPDWDKGKTWRLNDIVFKGIDNDGEMSAFATPGHHGVLILALPPHCPWYVDGLRENTAVVTFNGTLIDGPEHFLRLYEEMGAGAEIRLGTRTMLNGAAEIRTRK